ncbi:MAG: hypothetical protein M3M95_08225 [Pseudomonadota bacterium]|nr:hypothetical protein [Pseudomonadota bacterium]
MDAFEYLSVLISIVLGLALTQLLTGAARLVQARGRVRPYWPALLWTGGLLMILVQSWWAMFELRDHAPWTMAEFALILAHPTLLFFMSVLLLPDAELEGAIDLKANYYAQAPWFFAAATLVVLVSLARPIVFDGGFPLDADRIFQLFFLAAALACAVIRRERLHQAVAIALPLSLLVYFGLLFFQLR